MVRSFSEAPNNCWAKGFKLKTIKKYLRVDRKQIHFIRFILEGYDGIATLTTVDPQTGVVCLNIPPGCEDEVETVLQEIKTDVLITREDAAQRHRYKEK